MRTALPDDWDAWMRDAGAEASYTQTGHWARIHQTINGAQPHVLEICEAGRRVAAALFGYRPRPMGSIRDIAALALRGRGGVLECFGGPVILANAPARALAQLLERTDDLASRLGAAQVTFSAPPTTAHWPATPDVAALFAARGFACTPWVTALVDIARPDDAMLASFRQAARKGIRRCRELGIIVRACRDAADYLENFSRPLFATRRALGIATRPEIEERHWWDLDPDRHYRYFVASDAGGGILGTLGTYHWNGVATEIMSERTLPARETHSPAQDLLHWHAFQTHRDLGDRLFDLAGFHPAAVDAKEQGIRAFKEKWMGRQVPIPRFERRSDPPQYRIARTLYRHFHKREAHAG